jgi:uncharacterized FAD-dependent dehydrogenase
MPSNIQSPFELTHHPDQVKLKDISSYILPNCVFQEIREALEKLGQQIELFSYYFHHFR